MSDPVIIGDCTLYQGDCMDVMPMLGKVDAVLTDPPYGIGFGEFNRTNKDHKGIRYKANKYHNGDWDDQFDMSTYIGNIKIISDEIIIWGGNYFPCLWYTPTKGIIFWNKKQPVNNFSKGELAWSNIDMPAQYIEFAYFGNIEGKTAANEREHPTQKPIEVMKMCLGFFSKPKKVIDPFMGSGTTGVACAKLGKKFIGIELEPKYFDIACKRIEQAYAQPDMFVQSIPKPVQEKLEL